MKNKQAFTLIELLAVIIIIGLIAVIVIPKVNKTLKDSRKNVNEASTYALKRVADNYYAENAAKKDFEGCSYDFETNINTCEGLEFSGEKPDSGKINIDADGNVSIAVKFDDLCYKKSYSEENISSSDYNSYDCAVQEYNGWDGTSLAITPDGNTYYVSDSRHLAWISEQTNSGNSFEGKQIILSSDINMGATFDEDGTLQSGNAFTPIGLTQGNEFKGNFDGRNHKISNLYISESDNICTGLFGRYYGTEFKNLTVENSYIYGVKNNVGIVGALASDSEIDISNVKSINNIISGEGKNVGGIVGYVTNGNIENCYSNSNITSKASDAGGIVGFVFNGNVKNNINEGTVKSNTFIVGGIVGLIQRNGQIIGNINKGKVQGVEKWLGGIVGGINPVNSSVISFRVVSMNINYGEVITEKGAFRVGGIIGEGNDGILVYNNINYGNIDGVGDGTSTSYGTGGIIGSISTDNLSYVYNNINMGNIKGKISVGGILGNTEIIQNSGEIIKNSINEGTIEATGGFAGGIIGRYGNGVDNTHYVSDFVTNAYNKGTIKGDNAAGLVGSNIGIKNSITTGTLSGTNNYGVIGNIVSGVNISNVYYPNTDTSSYGTAFDKTTLDGTMVNNILGSAFNYNNGAIGLYEANIEISGFEITNVSYTNELLK